MSLESLEPHTCSESMAAPSQIYHEIYVSEFDTDRVRFFRQNSPWTSSPILSVLVFIALSTFIAFYMQARSLTRKMRPTASGVPTRLPATIVWGLFSLQYSQLSQYVQAQREQLHVSGLASSFLDCNASQVHLGLPSAGLGSNWYLPSHQLVRFRSKKYKLSSASQILPQVDELSALQQILVSSKLRSAVELIADGVSQQAVDMKDAQDKLTAVPSGKRLLDAESLLSVLFGSPNLEFVDHIQQNLATSENCAVESFTNTRRNIAEKYKHAMPNTAATPLTNY